MTFLDRAKQFNFLSFFQRDSLRFWQLFPPFSFRTIVFVCLRRFTWTRLECRLVSLSLIYSSKLDSRRFRQIWQISKWKLESIRSLSLIDARFIWQISRNRLNYEKLLLAPHELLYSTTDCVGTQQNVKTPSTTMLPSIVRGTKGTWRKWVNYLIVPNRWRSEVEMLNRWPCPSVCCLLTLNTFLGF